VIGRTARDIPWSGLQAASSGSAWTRPASRDDVYATNAVRHFKHEVRGKRRLPKKPNTAAGEACHAWIDVELRAVGSAVVVALGATSARSLLDVLRRWRPAGVSGSSCTAVRRW